MKQHTQTERGNKLEQLGNHLPLRCGKVTSMDMEALVLGNGSETAVEIPRLEKRKKKKEKREGSRKPGEQAGQPEQAPSPCL
ncbi:MAG: hypothetical protein LBD29_00310 [Treponema sp.]|nr:hypothetical protein [Treponema sp.]